MLLNPAAVVDEFQNAAGDLADELQFLKGKTAQAKASAGIAVSIPTDVVSMAFVTKAHAHARVSTSVDQNDINYLRGIQRSDTTALTEAGSAALLGNDEITRHLNSTASGRAAIVWDYGIALAHQFDVGGIPLSVGVTPKLQKTWVYNYTTSIYDYNSDDWNNDRYRTDDSGFNVDVGLAADLTENITVGLTGKNLVSRNIDTKDIRIENGMTGEVRNYKDTYQISPLVTAGVAWQNELLTLSADGDLTETKGFKSEKNSQYVGVGAEVRPLSWLAVRAGYVRMSKGMTKMSSKAVSVSHRSIKFYVDLMGLVGEDQTWGAGAQLSVTF